MKRVIILLVLLFAVPASTTSCEAIRGFGREVCKNSTFIADEGAKMLGEIPIAGGFLGAGWKFIINVVCKAITVPTEAAGEIGDTVGDVFGSGDVRDGEEHRGDDGERKEGDERPR